MSAASADSNFVGLADEQDAEGNGVLEEEDGSPTQEDGQRTCAFLGMECDNNNDFDIASVKALDNKLCSEVCLPGEWQSAEHELGGRRSPAHTPALTLGHPSPALQLQQEALGCATKPVAERK